MTTTCGKFGVMKRFHLEEACKYWISLECIEKQKKKYGISEKKKSGVNLVGKPCFRKKQTLEDPPKTTNKNWR